MCVVDTNVNVLCVICNDKCETEFLYFDPLENYHYVNGYISKAGSEINGDFGKVTKIYI